VVCFHFLLKFFNTVLFLPHQILQLLGLALFKLGTDFLLLLEILDSSLVKLIESLPLLVDHEGEIGGWWLDWGGGRRSGWGLHRDLGGFRCRLINDDWSLLLLLASSEGLRAQVED